MDEAIEMLKRYRSRKWQLTIMLLAIAVGFSAWGTLTSELSRLTTALGVSYNGFQGLIDWQKARKDNAAN